MKKSIIIATIFSMICLTSCANNDETLSTTESSVYLSSSGSLDEKGTYTHNDFTFSLSDNGWVSDDTGKITNSKYNGLDISVEYVNPSSESEFRDICKTTYETHSSVSQKSNIINDYQTCISSYTDDSVNATSCLIYDNNKLVTITATYAENLYEQANAETDCAVKSFKFI